MNGMVILTDRVGSLIKIPATMMRKIGILMKVIVKLMGYIGCLMKVIRRHHRVAAGGTAVYVNGAKRRKENPQSLDPDSGGGKWEGSRRGGAHVHDVTTGSPPEISRQHPALEMSHACSRSRPDLIRTA